MSVTTDGQIILDGAVGGATPLVIIKGADELREFDDDATLDLPEDSTRQAINVERMIAGLLKKADIANTNVDTTGNDPEGDARQDELKQIAGHCWWVELLQLEFVDIADEGWKAKRDWHLSQKHFYVALYLGLDKNLKKVTDPALSLVAEQETVSGGLRFIGVRGC